MISTAVLSSCKRYRYVLRRVWREDLPTLVYVMLNPSTADGLADDNTVKRCIAIAMNLGFGGIEVYNLFAWRATDPEHLAMAADPIGAENDLYLIQIPSDREIVVAWGALNTKLPKRLRGRASQVIKLLNRPLKCLYQLPKMGYPQHPLMIPAAVKLIPYVLKEAAHV